MHVAVVQCHVGLFRYKRLNFGISSASEQFQQAIAKVIAGLPGVLNISDDILVYGKSEVEHDEHLNLVLRRLEDNGITLGSEKNEFKKRSLLFCGHLLTTGGVKADPAKIRSIKALQAPLDVSHLRSLLGMTNYCAKFVPNYVKLVEPLLALLRKDAEWRWSSTEQHAFEQLQAVLSEDRVLGYFNPTLHTEVIVDAGPTGLGAVLVQHRSNGTKYVVAYASRALSDVERRYSQLEREGLAAVWGCEHFHPYIYGAEFDLITDNKPLEMLLRNPMSRLPVRLERWNLRLLPYKYHVRHIPGPLNPADYLSRYVHNSEIVRNERDDRVVRQLHN